MSNRTELARGSPTRPVSGLGYEAGYRGLSLAACPYTQRRDRETWRKGWERGRRDFGDYLVIWRRKVREGRRA